MLTQRQFQKNVERWALVSPKQALLLPFLNCDEVEFCQTKIGELNLRLRGKEGFYIHSNSDAAAESRKWFESLPLEEIQVLYVYGVGLGYGFRAAKEWLKKNRNRQLVFIDDDLQVVHRLFEVEAGSELLRHPQVHLYFVQDLEDWSEISEIVWNFSRVSHLHISALRSYSKHKNERFLELSHQISYDSAFYNAYLDEYFGYGISYFRNFYSNMLSLHKSYLGNHLFGKFKGVPAILCGAGPSLEKNVAQIGALKDKALIFAGGSAVNVLSNAGITPHFGAGIDPNSSQFERLQKHQVLDIPYFYRNRLYYGAFELIRGPRLYITGGGGYDVAEWFEEQLQIEGEPIDEGYNVVNFCVDIATAMGCNPIIFVGMDLAFTDLQQYAEGVLEDSSVEMDALLAGKDINECAVLRSDIDGRPIHTLWKWIAEAKWIGNYAKEHPWVSLVNATEGGIGFPGVPNSPLQQVSKECLKRSYAFPEWIEKEIQQSVMPQVTLPKMMQLMEELRDSLKRCVEHLDVLLVETAQTCLKIEQDKMLPPVLQSGHAALAEIELADEVGYRYVLEVFNIVFSRTYNYEIKTLNLRRYSEWKKVLKTLLFNSRKLLFLKDVALVNIELIDQSLARTL